MTDSYFELPQYDADEFTTDVECLRDTPGFFPVHSGRLPEGLSETPSPRVMIFGLDWGKQARAEQCRKAWADGRRRCRCQSFRPELRERYPTEGELFDVLVEAGVDLKTVFLTNAVLGLTKNQSGNVSLFGRYPQYLGKCGEYHLRYVSDLEPGLAVLMGIENLDVYGCSIWSAVWPELFASGGVWAGMRFRDAFESDRRVATAGSGWRVLLMHHPRSYTSPAMMAYRKKTVADLAAIVG